MRELIEEVEKLERESADISDEIKKLKREQPPAPDREFGSVIFFNEHNRYGFIRSENIISPDVWFHGSHIQGQGPLRTAQRVSYVMQVDHRGRPRATNVRVEPE